MKTADELEKESNLINHGEAMKFLGVSGETIKNWVRKKMLTRYLVDKKTFYNSDEIISMIRDGKTQDRNIAAVESYKDIPSCTVDERRFIVHHCKEMLSIVSELGLDWMSERGKYILLKSISSSGNFTDIGKETKLSRERVRQIFKREVRRIIYRFRRTYEQHNEDQAVIADLRKQIQELRSRLLNIPGNDYIKQEILREKRKALNIQLTMLDLSIRSLNGLKASDIHTLGDLVLCNRNDLLRINNFGIKSMEELDALLKKHGLEYGELV